ncbi:MAG: hypothetical protein MZV70_01840 [Desulfobacterales bacterium]|nr:hypothetical protein [Desulfobacterales bacterium]
MDCVETTRRPRCPRPHVTGRVTRSIDLHCDRGGGNKDYRITITSEGRLWPSVLRAWPGRALECRRGKGGFPREAEAVAERIAEVLEASEKLGEGLRERRRSPVRGGSSIGLRRPHPESGSAEERPAKPGPPPRRWQR